MNKKLLSELSKLKDYEFSCLEWHFWAARQIRDTMSKNAIDAKTMAEHIGVSARSMKRVLNGAYPFDLRIVSKLQSLQQSIASANTKFKVEAESIRFTEYKEQYPIYVKRIERLLEILEAKQKDAMKTEP